LLDDVLTVISQVVTVADGETPAVDPNQDCFLGITNLRLGPNIESVAVFTEIVANLSKL
jgi:hypothetical protein